MIFVIIFLSCLWSILLVDYFDPYKQILKIFGLYYIDTEEGPMRHLVSFNPIKDFFLFCITKMFNCSMCMSAWISAIVILCLGSWTGFILMPVAYFTTMLLKKIL